MRPALCAGRVHYMDWLRMGAVLAVVAYHALLPFGTFPWHVRNAERSDALALPMTLLPFALPVFFLLAGASARSALRTRSVRAFLVERTIRLLVPFVVGTLVLTLPTSYLIALLNSTWSGSFPAYVAAVPGMVLGIINGLGIRPLVLPVITMHLWFLAWLFLFCLCASPVFACLTTTRGRAFVDRLARASRRRAVTLLFAVPVTLIALPLFGVSSPAGWDWAAFGLWGGTFVGGYLLFSDERLVAAARRDLLPALAAAGLSLVGIAAVGSTDSIFRGGAHTYDATYVVVVGMHGLAAWAVTLSVLSLAMRVGFMQRPMPTLANEAVLPIYILHFPIVIAISFLVIQWPLGSATKAIINVLLGVGVSVLVAAAALRLPILRMLLGARRHGPTAVSAATLLRPSLRTAGS